MGLGPLGLRPIGVFSGRRGALLIDPPRLSKRFCPTVRVLRSWEPLACGGGAGGAPPASPICLVHRPGGRSHGACARSDAKMLRGFPARDPSLFHGTDQPYRPRSRVWEVPWAWPVSVAHVIPRRPGVLPGFLWRFLGDRCFANGRRLLRHRSLSGGRRFLSVGRLARDR
jgi:hypothetical protein